MKPKRWGLISLLVIWLVGGCGVWPAEPVESPLPTLTLETTVAPAPTPTATPASRLLTLTVWVPDFLNPYDAETGAGRLNAQLAAFTATHPDIQVQLIVKKAQGTGGLYHMLSTAYEAAPSVLPDLILLGQDDLRTAAEEGFILPMDDYLTLAEDYFPFARETSLVYSETFGIPLLVTADQMVYRGDIAATPPLSWTGVLTTNTSLLLPAAPANQLADDALLAMYLGAGGTIVDEQGQPTLDRNVLENLYRFFAAMVEDRLINPDQVLQLSDAAACWERYQEGQGRMSAVPAGSYWIEPPRDSRPAWVPTPEGRPIALARVWSVGLVAQDARRQEAAMELAQWLTVASRSAELNRALTMVPPRADALAFWGLLPEEKEFLQIWLEAAVPNPHPRIDGSVREALQSGLRVLLEGNVPTPEAAASHALTNLRQ